MLKNSQTQKIQGLTAVCNFYELHEAINQYFTYFFQNEEKAVQTRVKDAINKAVEGNEKYTAIFKLNVRLGKVSPSENREKSVFTLFKLNVSTQIFEKILGGIY